MTHERGAPLRTAVSIVCAVLLAVVALALHPHLTGHAASPAELTEIGTLRVRDWLVHGTLLLLLGVLLTASTSYALSRGLTRRPVVAGLVSFAVAIGSLFAAGLIDGFILPAVAARFVSAVPAVQNAAVATLAACSVAVNVLTAFAIVAMVIAIGAWSLDLVYDRGATRVAGLVGFVCAALTVALLARGGPFLTPHTLIAVVGAQGVWYVWIGLLLARRNA